MWRFGWLLFVGCGPKPAPVPDAAPPAGADVPVLGLVPPEHSEVTADRMHALLHLAETARYRLIRGDVEGARLSGAALATVPVSEALPPVWHPFVVDLLAEADALASSETPEAAGAAIGRMGLACGTCHVEVGSADAVRLAALPDDMEDWDARMWRHQWAADWMWLGLVTGDAGVYRLGAGVFVGENLPSPPEAAQTPALAPLLDEVTTAARAALAADGGDARAAAYGHLLATCAACHAAVGRGGPPGP